ncbi:hybrid sensor histidine kinase/response regulator transcription factor [Algibacter mikhailovii]|uniref:histidine kinase n=1 Tax=Algibacter mikhailovii TaxID=425498 RepID=A0A918R6R1_9FLAO|nr:hybrid sensor histidine kinase/response regulator transcription factor [Algibacter mikhailovii]GGZ87310.1 hybrid sensor histidine kinase/response regulator [Algibacter mikhailovii]
MKINEAEAQASYRFEHIDLPNEFSEVKAYKILEDSKGTIWFGFNNGLVVYDGYKGIKVDCVYEDGTKHAFGAVTSLVEDKNHKIWLGTSMGVFIYDPIKETSVYLKDSKINNKSCRSLSKSSKNEMLIGTDNGLFIYDTDGNFLEQYINHPGFKNSLSHNIVRCSYEDKSGNVWVGTFDKLNLLNRAKKQFSQFRLQKEDSLNHSNNLILSIEPFSKASDSILLVGTETGLCLFNTHNYQITQFSQNKSPKSISNSVVKTVCSVDDRVWLGTDLGLNVLDFNDNNFTKYFHEYNNSNSISNNVITDLLFDKQRNLWIATDSGVDKIYLNSNDILLNQFSKNGAFFREGVEVNGFSEQVNNKIWIATQVGAFEFDVSRNTYKQFLPPEILHNKVNQILYDKDGLVWMATTGGLNVYDPNLKTINTNVAKTEGVNILESNYITTVAQDSKGSIWIGTENKGLYKVIKKNKDNLEFINFKHDIGDENSLSSNSINDLAFDNNDNVWIATDNGLNCFNVFNGVIERFRDDSKFGQSPNENVSQVFVNKSNDVWVASYGGLYQWQSQLKKFKYYNNLPKHVTGVIEIDSMVYFAANKKLYSLNLKNYEFIKIPNNEIGLDHIEKVKLIKDNTILLTGKTGFSTLQTKDLKFKTDVSNVYWTNFSINNVEIKPYSEFDSRYIIDKHIDATNGVTLNYDENSFKVGFTSYAYNAIKETEYKYILEGYESKWNTTTDGQNYISYTQVRPGAFKLKVKASNNQGVFNGEERVLNITVKPPMHLSWWALLLYFIGFIGLILIYRLILINRERDKNELALEKLNNQKSAELIELKTRFFTNITHELKTPLTLIISPIDDLLTQPLEESTKKSLYLVKRNTDRLKKLVNQILDIRKIEAGAEKLRIQEYDIVKFSRQIVNQFEGNARKRNIFLQFKTNLETKVIWFDLEKVEKIIFNLLSNAFKFTPNTGSIIVSIELGKMYDNDDSVLISVSDTGQGIIEADQANIFDRFKSLSSSNYSNQKGTGIGLSLIYDYAKLHNGAIDFESHVDVGSKFIFTLPAMKRMLHDFDEVDQLEEDQIIDSEEEYTDIIEEIAEGVIDDKTKCDKLKALVVDDDPDMREFLVAGLSKKYEIFEAEDGQEGYNKAVKLMPDIIISDLMMPNIDGIAFCKKLKADLRISHIPFVLLTAKSGVDNKIIGIEIGADDYIQKPFNLDFLMARLDNLIIQRKSLRKFYLQQLQLEPTEITFNSTDEKFLIDLLAQVEKEIDNTDLSVKHLSELMGVSSSNLYRKIKVLTGQTATEFIRSIRLKRAAQLLGKGNLNVSEVMYMVGFTHRSYFTRCFKDVFGVSPKAYSKENNRD